MILGLLLPLSLGLSGGSGEYIYIPSPTTDQPTQKLGNLLTNLQIPCGSSRVTHAISVGQRPIHPSQPGTGSLQAESGLFSQRPGSGSLAGVSQ